MNNKKQISKWAQYMANQPTTTTTTYTYTNLKGQTVAVLNPNVDAIENFAEVMATLLEAATRQKLVYSTSQNVESNINVDRPYWPPANPTRPA